MYFHINDLNNKVVISGELVLFTTHTTTSEQNKTLCFLVYMHKVEINNNLFPAWSSRHLLANRADGSGREAAGSDYDYIEFSLGEFRNDYDFSISRTRHPIYK